VASVVKGGGEGWRKGIARMRHRGSAHEGHMGHAQLPAKANLTHSVRPRFTSGMISRSQIMCSSAIVLNTSI